MLCINRHDAIQRCGDPVNAKGLILGSIVGLSLDETLICQKLIVIAGRRVFHHQLKGTVSLLGNLAGDSICQRTEAEGREARIKKQRHAYYLANRDRIIEASKEYYRSHREEISTVNKEYYNAYNASGTRQGLIDALEEMHEYLGPDPEDQELKGFTESCIEKLKAMTDEEYRGTDLSSDLDKFIE